MPALGVLQSVKMLSGAFGLLAARSSGPNLMRRRGIGVYRGGLV